MDFFQLGLSPEVTKSVSDAGYETPTPIQTQAIPSVLAGRDVLACAQTGTGKTASFVLPMIDILAQGRSRARMPRALILEPTRELATQVADNFEKYGKYNSLSMALIIGGESMGDQGKLLNRGVDVLIATPGRLLDHFERGHMLLTDVKILVIDEADRMLDMGFIPDIEKLVSILPPRGRQTLFFSATMSPEIKILADKFLDHPKEITVSKPATTATTVTQSLIITPDRQKRETLRALLRREAVKNAIIFCNRKATVSTLLHSLKRHGFSVAALHGDMQQSARSATLESFRNNEVSLLVASDVAARGIDISDLSHVFNFDVPMNAEDYVHRIGRTGRAGRSGQAFTFATPKDGANVAAIEALIGQKIPRVTLEGTDSLQFDEDRQAVASTETAGAENAGGQGDAAAAQTSGRGKNQERKPRHQARRGRGRRNAETPAQETTPELGIEASPENTAQMAPESVALMPPPMEASVVAENVTPMVAPKPSDVVGDAVGEAELAPAPSGRRDGREGRDGRERNRGRAYHRDRDARDRESYRDGGRDGRDNNRGGGTSTPRVDDDFVYGAPDSAFGEHGPVPAFLMHRVKLKPIDDQSQLGGDDPSAVG